ncbi:MAG: oxygen-independent coproporphyrinogen III oxidase [Lachnospiraceae bacterium]|nr:oxygen-independent coproporphyrinogen III oxidase [Lachnospiraceae bacterium]
MMITKSELYIHIPFCVRKCLYCDFLSFSADEKTKEKYIDALCKELMFIGKERCKTSLSSVFFGGGTPSVLPVGLIERVMECVKENFTLDRDAEVTIECNPGTVNEDKMKAYFACGINRISFGLQSVHDEELKKLGRIHSYEDFLGSYENAVKAGFTNINVDLMSDIPGQTVDSWTGTLKTICELKPAPSHISAYSLIVEEGTPFADMAEDGRLDIPDEDTDREMYHMTSRLLSDYGYGRYEISNYAKEGFECRHNLGYWTGVTYFGAGLVAASYYDGCRFTNTSDLPVYMDDPIDSWKLDEKLTNADKMSEFMLLGLRLTKGINTEEFRDRFSRNLYDVYGRETERFKSEGLLVEENGFIHLTEQGLDLANHVMQAFI